MVRARGGPTQHFPLTLTGKSSQLLKPRPINNARADKLVSFMWRHSFLERRCLVPMSEFAEAEDEKGSKTRACFTLPDEPVFAVANLERHGRAGPSYSMIVTEACIQVAGVHDRMPVILRRDDCAIGWTDHRMQQGYSAALIQTGWSCTGPAISGCGAAPGANRNAI